MKYGDTPQGRAMVEGMTEAIREAAKPTMRASVVLDMAVVRAPGPRKCQGCGKVRVVFGFGVTMAPMGNPPTFWKCASCWGLR